jgi:MFS family permease
MSIADADPVMPQGSSSKSAVAEAFQAPGMRKLVIAGGIGTAIEWYEYFLYGFIAPLAFEKIFFPKVDPRIGLIVLYATYATGFAARPLGGIFFGHFGDRIGRKTMMLVTLLTMGVATVGIGLLPTYDQIGITAVVLLVCLRFMQGFSLAGESIASGLLILENSVKGRRGLTGSFMQMAGPIGVVLASLSAFLIAKLSEADLLAWGWRVPFLISFILIGVGLYIRMSIEDSPAFLLVKQRQAQAKVPALDALNNHPREILTVFFVTAAESSFFILTAVFSISYMVRTLGLDRDLAPFALLIANIVSLVAMPIFGGLSDRVGRKRLYVTALIAAVAFFCVWFNLLETKSTWVIVLSVIAAVGLIDACMNVIQGSFFLEMFPTRVRFTGVAIGKQFGILLGGGITPIVAAWMLSLGTAGTRYIVYYYLCVAAVALVTLLFTRDTRDRDIMA